MMGEHGVSRRLASAAYPQQSGRHWGTPAQDDGKPDDGPGSGGAAWWDRKPTKSGTNPVYSRRRSYPRRRLGEAGSKFDTSRFESWQPSQPPGSLHGNFVCRRKCRHFRRLEGKDPVSRQEFWRNRTESRESRGESLLDDFSISGNWIRGRPETGCVSAETGSNPHRIGGRVVESLVKVLGRPISDAVDEADGSSRHVTQAAALGALLAAGRDACRDCLSCHMRKPVMPNKSGRNPDRNTSTVQIGPKP
jgi:hypothetical protein